MVDRSASQVFDQSDQLLAEKQRFLVGRMSDDDPMGMDDLDADVFFYNNFSTNGMFFFNNGMFFFVK